MVATGMASLCGCDPVRTTNQNFTIDVEDAQGLPVPDAKVRIKESWESWQTWGGGTAESEKSYLRQRWESDFVPWLKGVTNDQGKAVLN